MSEVRHVTECRICASRDLHPFLSLGDQPLANAFLKSEADAKSEKRFPLGTTYCAGCGLVQLTDVVAPEVLFKREYLYIPSTSKVMHAHFSELAAKLTKKFGLSKDTLVVDIGSNDGLLLTYFKALGVKTLGIEPAANVAKAAEKQGIETVVEFFNEETAKTVAKQKGHAKLALGTNVFAHVDDIRGFVKGLTELLDEDGVFVVEAPYLLDLVKKLEFDTVYHEHMSYLAVRPLVKLFEMHGMRVVDVERIPIHGGSIRVYASRSKSAKPSPAVAELLALEKSEGLGDIATYQRFAKSVEGLRDELVSLVGGLKAQGKRIVAYAAPAKGTVMLNYCGIGKETLDYAVDSIPYKQGLYTPGTHLKVYTEDKILSDKPDYALILAWNFADEIIKKNSEFRENGGKFIVPVPKPRIV